MKLNYYLYRLAGSIVPKVPPAVGYRLCNVMGGLSYRLNGRARANVCLNMQRVLGDQVATSEIQGRARLTFNYVFYNYFDMFRLPRLDDATVDRLVTVEGWHNVETALAEGKGIVMTTAHLGNLEIVIYAFLRRGLTITSPVERVEPPELFEYLVKLRSSKGQKLIPIDAPLLDIVRTLKKGGIAGIAGDRDITNSGRVVQFFNHPARLPDGHVRLALRTGAPLMVGFSRRNPDHTYQAHFLPPFHLPKTGTPEERVAAGMEFVLTEMEKAIRQIPEQWVVTTSVWVDG